MSNYTYYYYYTVKGKKVKPSNCIAPCMVYKQL